MIQSRQIGEFKHQIDVESVANICKLNLNINENEYAFWKPMNTNIFENKLFPP